MKTGVLAGAFDIIHPGYVYMFEECKRYCDRLVVLLQEDPSLERPNKLKPILSLDERALILKSIRFIDEVVSYRTESDFYNYLTHYNPDVRFLGEDYRNKHYTGSDLHIPIHYLDRSHGWSATRFKQLICHSLNNKPPSIETPFI